MPVDDQYYPLEVPRLVTERACDGLIVIGTHLSSATTDLLLGGPPVVLVDAYAEDAAFDSISSDNVGGGRAAVEHLIGRGHTQIAIVGSQPDSYPSIGLRRRGYEARLAEADLRPHFADGPHAQPERAAAAAIQYLDDHPEVSAAFCCNDDVAVALIQAAQRSGIAIPERLSVVGHDDIDVATFVTPHLTTLAVDKVGMGRLAVTLLLHRLENGSGTVSQTFIRPRLVERESVAVRPGVAIR
jgi:LacI family transcriptional regulator